MLGEYLSLEECESFVVRPKGCFTINGSLIALIIKYELNNG